MNFCYNVRIMNNAHGEIIFSDKDLLEAIYSGNFNVVCKSIPDENTEIVEVYNRSISQCGDKMPLLTTTHSSAMSTAEFDTYNQQRWFFPEEYKTLDIEAWLFTQCTTACETERVTIELLLFKERSMLDVLRCSKYLVDTMRKNKLFWGVGRGSSVASYCLFLIGLHKIDSIKHKLDITEFLK